MNIFLTGGSGFVGSAVLQHLIRAGHDVAALARSDASAAAVEAGGATAVRGEITDVDLLVTSAVAADAMIHAASPGDAGTEAADTGVLDAVLPALAGTGKAYVHTSGVWIHGNGEHLTETSPFDPPAITAWRLPLDARVRAAAGDGVRSVVIAPGVVYGHGGGLPNLIRSAPRPNQALQYPGGEQHWTTVHVDDLAALYVRALDAAPAGSYYLGVGGDNPLVEDLARAASHAAGLDGRVEQEPDDEARQRLGVLYEALTLDQEATGAHARSLGWAPKARTLVDELVIGSYADLDG